jgi:hypothetical protein
MTPNYYSMFADVTNYYNITPYLYRYENQRYIDAFFASGDIFISSFKQYRSYKDNELGDKEEGHSMNFGYTDDNHTMGRYTMVGNADYCFSTSTILDKKLLETFRRDSTFRIKHPINFMLEIARSLQRVREVIYGNCIYLNHRMVKKQIGSVTLESLRDEKEPDKISMEKMMNVPVDGPESYFMKTVLYQHQSEYRIIWKTDREVSSGIVLRCPEAIKYCEKVKLDEITIDGNAQL